MEITFLSRVKVSASKDQRFASRASPLGIFYEIRIQIDRNTRETEFF